MALDSIAGRYSAQLMHAFDSEQVLGKQGCRSLSSCCSERTTWPSGSELSTPPKASMETNNETASYRSDSGSRFCRAGCGRDFLQPLRRDDGPLRRSNFTTVAARCGYAPPPIRASTRRVWRPDFLCVHMNRHVVPTATQFLVIGYPDKREGHHGKLDS